MKCDFTYRHYSEILQMGRGEGYQFSSFLETSDRGKRIYLRHDIDISIENSLKIATIEKENEVIATFFLQMNSPFYNIFEDHMII